MLHTYKTTPGDLAGYGGPKGIMGVGVILLVSLTSAMEGILRMQQMVVLRSSFWKILVRIQPLRRSSSAAGLSAVDVSFLDTN